MDIVFYFYKSNHKIVGNLIGLVLLGLGGLLGLPFEAKAACSEDFYFRPTDYHVMIRGQCSTHDEALAACTAVAASHGYTQDYCLKNNYSEYGYNIQGGWFHWWKYVRYTPFTFVIYSYQGGEFVSPSKNMDAPKCADSCFGDPINAGNGNKFESHTYYKGVGAFPLEVSVTYNSKGDESPQTRSAGMFGRNRSHFYARYLRRFQGPNTNAVYAYRPSGNAIKFVKSSGTWIGNEGVTLKEDVDAAGAQIGWLIESGAEGREYYNLAGRLLYLEDTGGRRQTLTFNPNGDIEKVTDNQGRAIEFTFNSSGRVLKSTLPDGKTIEFVYSGSGDLTEVKHQDGSVEKYLYDEPAYSAAPATGALTGQLDQAGVRFQTTTYDNKGRATSTSLAGGVDAVSAVYTASAGGQYNQSAQISTSAGLTRQVSFSVVNGEVLVASSAKTCVGCQNDVTTYSFDSYGRFDTLSRNGVVTDYDYSPDGLMLRKREAIGTADERVTEITWDTEKKIPVEVVTGGASAGAAYKVVRQINTRGQVVAETEFNATALTGRRTTTAYCEAADVAGNACPFVGLPISVDGPRGDVSDHILFSYRQEAAPTCSGSSACPYRKGDLWKVTNAKGHVTEYLEYDGAGRVLSVKDPNDVITHYEYHPRGWLTATKVRGPDNTRETDDAITRIEYWPTGLVKQLTQPDGAFTRYTYDPAHRLTHITDNVGNTIRYVLDNAGNRIAEETKDAQGTLTRSLSRVYNALGQLTTQADALAHPTDFTYDARGNLTSMTDALGRVTNYAYDPLNRLVRTLQDVGGIAAQTQLQYDAQDRLTQVTDPKGLATTYTITGLGELTQLHSPDTGTTTATYDSAGNRITQTDARGITTTYTYDALNRLTQVSYPDTGLTTTYTYDTRPALCPADETFSSGRLSRIDDASGHTQYCYNRLGHVVRKVQTTQGVSLVVRYAYTLAGNLQAMVYPDGTAVDYTRNAHGQVTDVGVTRPGQPRQGLLSQATYAPFGPLTGWTDGHGRQMQRRLDLNYRPATLHGGGHGLDLRYTFDAAGQLTHLASGSPPPLSYHYDALGRLTQTRDGPTQTPLDTYTYDATGNRTTHTTAAGTASYTYPATTHRLTAVAGVPRSYDAAGNTTAIGTDRAFLYNDAGRLNLVQRTGAPATHYTYNGRGEQVHRQQGSTARHSLYDEAGHWLGDYDATGTPLQQALWLDNLPVGLLANGHQLHYLQPDHLGTPRIVIEAARNVPVWTWDNKGEAFGNTAPQQDPDGDGIAFIFDMRFPGQRYDAASGLNQNGNRDYESATGRYPQPDPIGLSGGINAYAYVDSNPLIFTDALGLAKDQACVAAYTIGGAVCGGAAGYYGGGVLGGVGGAAVCSPTGPGAAACAVGGAAGGSTLGGAAGSVVGGILGNLAGQVMCQDDEKEREKRCNENLQRDLATCRVLGNRFGKKAFAVCEQQAMLRYGNCLSGRDEGIDAPLPPWGKL